MIYKILHKIAITAVYDFNTGLTTTAFHNNLKGENKHVNVS